MFAFPYLDTLQLWNVTIGETPVRLDRLRHLAMVSCKQATYSSVTVEAPCLQTLRLIKTTVPISVDTFRSAAVTMRHRSLEFYGSVPYTQFLLELYSSDVPDLEFPHFEELTVHIFEPCFQRNYYLHSLLYSSPNLRHLTLLGGHNVRIHYSTIMQFFEKGIIVDIM